MYRLSSHFFDQWKKRVGGKLPTTRKVARLIDEAVKIQNFQLLYTSRGHQVKILEIYWHSDRALFFKVDCKKKKVVTVLNRSCAESEDSWQD